VADLLTLVAGERDLLGFAVVQQIDLVVAGPDMVAVLAVELDFDGVRMAVLQLEGYIGSRCDRTGAKSKKHGKGGESRALTNGFHGFPLKNNGLRRVPASIMPTVPKASPPHLVR